MSTGIPSAAALAAARARHQEAMEGIHAGSMTVGETIIACGLIIGAVTWELGDGGWKLVQRATVNVRKALLASPTQGLSIMIEGKGFKVAKIAGHQSTQPAWVLRLTRTPGRDEAPGPPP